MEDNNQPADHFQMPAMIKLKSSDGVVLEVEAEVAKLSLTIKEMLDDLGVDDNEVIPIPQNAPEISGALLKKIIKCTNQHKNDLVTAEDDEKKAKPTEEISSWDAEFLQVPQLTFFQLIRATDYLNMKALLDLTCKDVASSITGMTAENVRRKCIVDNDLNPSEKIQIFTETLWCDEFQETLRCRIRPRYCGMNVDQDADQIVKHCFRNAVVVRRVFEHTSNQDLLLELQLVNKLWNYEARSVMRERGTVCARLKCDRTLYDEDNLEAFGVQLRQMNVVPYSGLFIEVDHTICTVQPSALDSTYEAILDRLPLKHLSVRINSYWSVHENCPVLLLVKKLLEGIGGILEELTLNFEEDHDKFIEKFVQNYSFPALKILKFEIRLRPDVDYIFGGGQMADVRCMKALVSSAENLQELHTPFWTSNFMLRNILDGRESVKLVLM